MEKVDCVLSMRAFILPVSPYNDHDYVLQVPATLIFVI